MNTTWFSGQTTSLDLRYKPKTWNWTELSCYLDWCMGEDELTLHYVTHVKVTRYYRPQMYLRCANCAQVKMRMGAPSCHWPRREWIIEISNLLTHPSEPVGHKCPKCEMTNLMPDLHEINGVVCISCGFSRTRNAPKDFAGTIPGQSRSNRIGT